MGEAAKGWRDGLERIWKSDVASVSWAHTQVRPYKTRLLVGADLRVCPALTPVSSSAEIFRHALMQWGDTELSPLGEQQLFAAIELQLRRGVFEPHEQELRGHLHRIGKHFGNQPADSLFPD